MDISTHKNIDKRLCGVPIEVSSDRAAVELVTDGDMAVDDKGLVHGGFIFGLADHAAMLAVNDPYVVLGAADVKFIKPAKVGQRLVAKASIQSKEKTKYGVEVEVCFEQERVFLGMFTCFVLSKHVLD